MSLNNEDLRFAINLIADLETEAAIATMKEASIPFQAQQTVHVLRHGLELHRAQFALRKQLEELLNRGTSRATSYRAEEIVDLGTDPDAPSAVFKSTNNHGSVWRVVVAGELSSYTFPNRDVALLHWIELSNTGRADNAAYYAARVLGIDADE